MLSRHMNRKSSFIFKLSIAYIAVVVFVILFTCIFFIFIGSKFVLIRRRTRLVIGNLIKQLASWHSSSWSVRPFVKSMHMFFMIRQSVLRGVFKKNQEVTTLCWWFYDADRFKILVTESLCWRLFSVCWSFFQFIKSATNISNLSPTFCLRHPSPTSISPNQDSTRIQILSQSENDSIILKTNLVNEIFATKFATERSFLGNFIKNSSICFFIIAPWRHTLAGVITFYQFTPLIKLPIV